jgi:DNA-binding NarL/FixJ family response regulator
LTSAQNSDSRIKVLVADQVAMSCQLLSEALMRNRRFHALPATSVAEALQLLGAVSFDVILVGAGNSFDPSDRVRTVREIRGVHRAANVVVLLDALERNLVVEAFRSGARGVFCRAESFETLCKCILCVHEGQIWAGSAELQFVLEALVRPLPFKEDGATEAYSLSKREEEIARLVAEGCSNREISRRLGLSEHTIKNYLFRIFEKLGVSTRVELALYALKRANLARARPKPEDALLQSGLDLVG